MLRTRSGTAGGARRGEEKRGWQWSRCFLGGVLWKLSVVLLLALVGPMGTTASRAQSAPSEEGGYIFKIPPPADLGVMTDQVIRFEQVVKGWLPEAKRLARGLLILLIGLELLVSGAMWGLSRTGPDQIVYRLTIKIFVFALILKVIQDTGVPGGLLNLEHIPNGFRAMAAGVTQLDPVYPSDVMRSCSDVINSVWEAATSSSWMFVWVAKDFVLASTLIIFLAFAFVAIRLFIAILHSILVAIAGLVLLGFAGFRATAGIADRYLAWAIAVSIRLFLIQILVAVCQQVMNVSYSGMSIDGFSDLLMWNVVALSYAGLVLYVPNSAAKMLMQGVDFRIASAVQA
jgi:P-type conjugative transfer protein TrbL